MSTMVRQMFSTKQAVAISRSNARVNILQGAVRSGKTHASLWRWIKFVTEAPPGNLLMWGRTERTLKRNILDPLAELLGPSRFKLISGSGEAFILGRRVYLAGANDERSVAKIQGLTLVGAYGDELSLTPESFFTMVLSRLSIGGAKLFGTTNPDSPAHWLKARFLDRSGDLDLYNLHFTLDDNPVLPAAYVAALKREYTGLWYKRYIDGLWVAAEGAIYDMFDHDRHVVTKLPRISRTWLAFDYGTSNPFVALLIGLGVDDCLYIVDEWRWDSSTRGRQLTDAEYSRNVRAWLNDNHKDAPRPERIYYDPSAASFGVQLWRDKWHGITPADNSVNDGIRITATLLSLGRLKVHTRCKGLLDEMPGYRWDAKAQKQGEDKPVKQADHGPDAARYGVMGLRSVWRRWIGNAERIVA